MKTVIFDLDGTLADITKRREMSTKENGKIDWDTFFTPENIWFDTPNKVVIQMALIIVEFVLVIRIVHILIFQQLVIQLSSVH